MKIPLHYQISECDCGPTAMLNALSYLFEREEIPPEVIRNVMLYSLDCYNSEGIPCKSGTSRMAMMFLSHWLNDFGRIGRLPITSSYLSGEDVFVGEKSRINDILRRGGAVVVRLFLDEWHYVTLTGAEDGKIRMFDPYYWTEEFPQKEAVIVMDHPMEYNRIVPEGFFNREETELYALGPKEGREAVLLANQEKIMTEEKTIEYFI
ncbi:MAG: peptidase C39 [Lachnospiraceae bacterium]|nr:peptidase C39 [Lachnospiraceae bacterium]